MAMLGQLTGMPSVWQDLNLTSTPESSKLTQLLKEQADMLKKRKLLGAGAPNGNLGVAQTLLGSGMGAAAGI